MVVTGLFHIVATGLFSFGSYGVILHMVIKLHTTVELHNTPLLRGNERNMTLIPHELLIYHPLCVNYGNALQLHCILQLTLTAKYSRAHIRSLEVEEVGGGADFEGKRLPHFLQSFVLFQLQNPLLIAMLWVDSTW